MLRLSAVKKGQRVRVKHLYGELDSRPLLMGVGILPGDEIQVVGESVLGSPLAIQFGENDLIAMRVQQADLIEVEEV